MASAPGDLVSSTGRTDRVPRVAYEVTKFERACRYLMGLVLPIILISWLYWSLWGGKFGTALSLAIMITISIAYAATLVMWMIARTRGKRIVLASQKRICPGCLYDLRTLEESGLCPECGRPYTPSSLKDAWERTYMLPFERVEQ
jgi:hypothetical protein